MFEIIKNSFRQNENKELEFFKLQFAININFKFDINLEKKIIHMEMPIFDQSKIELEIEANKVEYFESSFNFLNNKYYVLAKKIDVSDHLVILALHHTENFKAKKELMHYPSFTDIPAHLIIDILELDLDEKNSTVYLDTKYKDAYLVYIYDMNVYKFSKNVTSNEIDFTKEIDNFKYNGFKIFKDLFLISIIDKFNDCQIIEVYYKMIGLNKVVVIPSLVGVLSYDTVEYVILIVLQEDIPKIYNLFKNNFVEVMASNKFQSNFRVSSKIVYYEEIDIDCSIIILENTDYIVQNDNL